MRHLDAHSKEAPLRPQTRGPDEVSIICGLYAFMVQNVIRGTVQDVKCNFSYYLSG